MDRAQKKEVVASLNGTFKDTNVVIVCHYSGLSAAQIGKLRRQVRGAGASIQVAKNRLVRLALDGTDYAGLADLFTGPTAITVSNDPVAAAKAVADFAKTNDKFVILGGAMGRHRLDENGVKALATLPSLDELRGKLIGLIQAPATKVAGVVQAPAASLARVISAYSNKEAA